MTRQTKPAIIMIHGFRGTHDGLALIASGLPDFKVIIPDLPGFADGDTLDQHDLDHYVTWLHGYIAKQELAIKPVLLGHSFGSIITAAYAAKYADTISQLILVNPIGAPALEGPKAVLTRLAIFYYWLGRKLPTKLAHSWLSSKTVVNIMSRTMTKTDEKSLRAYIKDQHLTHFSKFHTPKSVSESFLTSVSHNVREFAADIDVPVLMIAGDQDDITPIKKQQELVALFQHATLIVIENVGHLTHYETPDQVADAISGFISANLDRS